MQHTTNNKDQQKEASVRRKENGLPSKSHWLRTSLSARLKKKERQVVSRAGQVKLSALPEVAPQHMKRALQQTTWQSQIASLPKGAPGKTARALTQKTYQKKCSILDAMYP